MGYMLIDILFLRDNIHHYFLNFIISSDSQVSNWLKSTLDDIFSNIKYLICAFPAGIASNRKK